MRLRQRRYKRVPLKIMSELNMTPMIDVTFLMLIAFIVTYPLVEASVRINLPRVTLNKPEQVEKNKPHNLEINAYGDLFFDKNATTLEALEAELISRVLDNPDTGVVIRGDESINYGQLMKVVAVLNRAQVKRMQLMTFAESSK